MKEESTVFLCGYPKSGTTLLLSLLDNHLQLNTFPEELKTFSGVLKEKGLKNKINNILTKTGAYVPKVGIANYPSGVRDYSSVNGEEYIESLEKLLLKSTTDKELFTNIFKNWLLFSSNKKNFKTIKYNVEKTPHNELYSDIALRWFNNSKFIYIIRDPRDNYLSYKKKQTSLTLMNYIYAWKKSIQSLSKIPRDKLLIIKYENLVSDLDKYLKEICEFLSIEYNETLTQPTRNGVLWEGNSMFNNNSKSVHSQATGRYKNKLTINEIECIEQYLYDELSQFDYQIDYVKQKKQYPLIRASYHNIRNFISSNKNRLSEIK